MDGISVTNREVAVIGGKGGGEGAESGGTEGRRDGERNKRRYCLEADAQWAALYLRFRAHEGACARGCRISSPTGRGRGQL